MYSVVVCSRCQYVWIAKDRPKTSKCGRCRRRRKFKKLLKYHETTDKEEAKFARAFYQSRVNDQEEAFDRALDQGHLDEHMDAFLSEQEFLDLKGLDGSEVEDAVENLLKPRNERSEVRILQDGFNELENPDLDEILEYASEYEVSEESAVLKLEGLLRDGGIDDSGQVVLSDVEELKEEMFDRPDPEPDHRDEDREPSDSSERGIVLTAVDRHGDESVDAVLDFAVKKGLSRGKAITLLEKLSEEGIVGGDISSGAIAEARMALTEEDPSNQEQSESEEQGSSDGSRGSSGSLSQRDVMLKAFEDLSHPTEEDVVEFAGEHGLSRDKAQRLLSKMSKHGEVSRRPDGSLRML